MKPSRASLVVPLVTTSLIVLVLLALGAWQLQRRVEKVALIAALTERLAASPVPLPAIAHWQSMAASKDEFRRVTLRATLDPSASVGVYASGSPLRKDVSGQGVWVFAPARLAGGEVIIINQGFLPDAHAALLREAEGPAVAEFTGYIRFPERPGWLTPPGDVVRRLWFARDIAAMAQGFGWEVGRRLAPFYIDLEAPAPASGWPRPGPLTVNLKNDHLQYALTWFSLAIAVLIAFAVWLRGRNRSA